MFSGNLLLKGVNLLSDLEAIGAIDYEISMRPHTMNSKVSCSNKEKAEIDMYVETDRLDEVLVGNGMAE